MQKKINYFCNDNIHHPQFENLLNLFFAKVSSSPDNFVIPRIAAYSPVFPAYSSLFQKANITQYPKIKNKIKPADTPIMMYGTFSLEYIIQPGKISNPSTFI